MKTKTKLTAILCAIILATNLVAACASSDEASVSGDGGYGMSAPESGNPFRNSTASMADESYGWDDAASPMEPEPMPESEEMASGGSSSSGITPITAPVTGNLAEKIIFSYYAEIETLNFDGTVTTVNDLIATHGAFVEQSEINGNYYADTARGHRTYRYAYYIIRVPVNELNAVTSKLGTLGNIVNQRSNAENITAQFTDQESRLTALRIQEDRLLSMLEQSTRIADMIEIEHSLSGIRYEIERITSTLTNWQRMVDYSTLTLSIQEVEEYREIIGPDEPQPGYWEEMGIEFMKTLRGVGDFFAAIFMWIVVNAPVLIILAAIGVAMFFIVRRQLRKSRERAEELWQRRRKGEVPAPQDPSEPTDPPQE